MLFSVVWSFHPPKPLRTAPTRDALYPLNLAANLLVEHGVGQEDQPVHAGVWVGVLMLFAWAEYARLFGVHSGWHSLSVGRVPGCSSTCGAIPAYAGTLTQLVKVLSRHDYLFLKSFDK